jgi:F-type H+-transporting ATPase subunit a
MPQITFPFYYLADLSAVFVLFGALLVFAGVYALPAETRTDAARVALSSAAVLLSPLEQFRGAPVFGLEAFGSQFAVTTLGLWAGLAALVFALLFAMRSSTLSGDRFTASLRAVSGSVYGLASDGGKSTALVPLLPFFYTTFLFLLLLNLVANVPYGFSSTASLVVALGLSLTVWFYCTALGLSAKGLHFFAHFVPAGTPLALVPLLVLIETISYTARALSLGVRLFANMLAGHTLLAILSGFLGKLLVSSVLVGLVCLLPFGIFVALVGLEIAVSFIQAYVFLVLAYSYLDETGGISV